MHQQYPGPCSCNQPHIRSTEYGIRRYAPCLRVSSWSVCRRFKRTRVRRFSTRQDKALLKAQYPGEIHTDSTSEREQKKKNSSLRGSSVFVPRRLLADDLIASWPAFSLGLAESGACLRSQLHLTDSERKHSSDNLFLEAHVAF